MCAGACIAHSDDALVLHPVRPARWAVSISQQSKSQFEALLYKKHPALFRERIRHRPPLLYYAILVAALATLGALIAGHPSVALAPGLAWAALTSWFCAKRLVATTRTPSHVLEMACTSAVIPFLSVFWRLYGAVKFRVVFV
jgi:hypothetical protein